MLIELNRFMTTAEVRREYRIPAALADEIAAKLPVVLTEDDGTHVHLQGDVDEFLAEFSRQRRKAVAQQKPVPSGKPGRSDDTLEVALYANELRRAKKTWKEVFQLCRERWPNDDRVDNSEQIRATQSGSLHTLRESFKPFAGCQQGFFCWKDQEFFFSNFTVDKTCGIIKTSG